MSSTHTRRRAVRRATSDAWVVVVASIGAGIVFLVLSYLLGRNSESWWSSAISNTGVALLVFAPLYGLPRRLDDRVALLADETEARLARIENAFQDRVQYVARTEFRNLASDEWGAAIAEIDFQLGRLDATEVALDAFTDLKDAEQTLWAGEGLTQWRSQGGEGAEEALRVVLRARLSALADSLPLSPSFNVAVSRRTLRELVSLKASLESRGGPGT